MMRNTADELLSLRSQVSLLQEKLYSTERLMCDFFRELNEQIKTNNRLLKLTCNNYFDALVEKGDTKYINKDGKIYKIEEITINSRPDMTNAIEIKGNEIVKAKNVD